MRQKNSPPPSELTCLRQSWIFNGAFFIRLFLSAWLNNSKHTSPVPMCNIVCGSCGCVVLLYLLVCFIVFVQHGIVWSMPTIKCGKKQRLSFCLSSLGAETHPHAETQFKLKSKRWGAKRGGFSRYFQQQRLEQNTMEDCQILAVSFHICWNKISFC